ncbi:SWIB domain-containing protein [Haematococcus lacustris]|uniref:SWIB domain-containing protein n=1 Tax=Haematococcus lacustris TaxID=44745 RepID=A0A699YQH3_HAELA|nr:SWIB domain-containing protein [Haematococcus lacustris]
MAAASAPGTYGAARPSEQARNLHACRRAWACCSAAAAGDLAPPIKKRFFNRKRDRLGVMPSDKDFKDKLANALADSPAYNVLVEQQRHKRAVAAAAASTSQEGSSTMLMAMVEALFKFQPFFAMATKQARAMVVHGSCVGGHNGSKERACAGHGPGRQTAGPRRQVDDLITRRRAQVRDSLQRLDRVARRLRITITNTHSNQPHAAVAPGSASPTHARPHAQPTSHSHSGSDVGQLPAEPPSWSLIIHGRVVEGAELVQHNQQAHPQPTGATDSAHVVKVVGVAGAPVQPTATTAGAAGGPAAAGVHQAGATAVVGVGAGGAAAAVPAANQAVVGGTSSAVLQAAQQAAVQAQQLAPKQPFTHYLRRVEVQLEAEQGAGEVLVWDKAVSGNIARDGLEVRRLGSQPCKAKPGAGLAATALCAAWPAG